MNIYWYISKAKLDMLKDQKPGFLNGISAKLSFKLPFVSGSLSGTEKSKLVDDLRRVIKALESEGEILSYDQLAGSGPVLFRFEGPCVRRVLDDVFWLATYRGSTALLLAGSAGFAIGGAPPSATHLSPSADPISAIKAAFDQGSDSVKVGGAGMELSGSLSYAWQELVRGEDETSGTLPKARGLAFFARTLNADNGKMSRVGKQDLKTLVIGTPLYVEQF
jgi:hypothetical protein